MSGIVVGVETERGTHRAYLITGAEVAVGSLGEGFFRVVDVGAIEDEHEALHEETDEQRKAIREALAEDLGGEPEEYDTEEYLNDRAGEPVADGGE